MWEYELPWGAVVAFIAHTHFGGKSPHTARKGIHCVKLVGVKTTDLSTILIIVGGGNGKVTG